MSLWLFSFIPSSVGQGGHTRKNSPINWIARVNHDGQTISSFTFSIFLFLFYVFIKYNIIVCYFSLKTQNNFLGGEAGTNKLYFNTFQYGNVIWYERFASWAWSGNKLNSYLKTPLCCMSKYCFSFVIPCYITRFIIKKKTMTLVNRW